MPRRPRRDLHHARHGDRRRARAAHRDHPGDRLPVRQGHRPRRARRSSPGRQHAPAVSVATCQARAADVLGDLLGGRDGRRGAVSRAPTPATASSSPRPSTSTAGSDRSPTTTPRSLRRRPRRTGDGATGTALGCRGDRGAAAIEMPLAVGLLLLPIAMVVMLVPQWPERQTVATRRRQGGRHALRATPPTRRPAQP